MNLDRIASERAALKTRPKPTPQSAFQARELRVAAKVEFSRNFFLETSNTNVAARSAPNSNESSEFDDFGVDGNEAVAIAPSVRGDDALSAIDPRFIRFGAIEHDGFSNSDDESDLDIAREKTRAVVASKKASLMCSPKDAPVYSFDDPRLPPDVFGKFHSKTALKFRSPTPIQSEAWPGMLRFWDLVCVSPTGSGKTLAYALPLAVHCQANARFHTVTALVLGPTRELVQQIAKTMSKFQKWFDVDVTAVYGGQNEEFITARDILVATPGRALDLLTSRKLDLSKTSCVVLDEADRMLQMGFREDVDFIVAHTQPEHQTVLTSATWTPDAKRVVSSWLKNDFKEIIVGAVSGGEKLTTIGRKSKESFSKSEDPDAIEDEDVNKGGSLTLPKQIVQTVHLCAEHKKPRKLIRHIERIRKTEADHGRARNPGPMIVFCNKIKTVMFVYEFLARQEIRVVALHGSMAQDKRNKALADFRAGKYTCLIATDVAGRGLHIDALEHVVNYDFPPSLAQYAHRVGRCGRGKEKRGSALSFFTKNLSSMAPDLVKLLIACEQPVDPNLKSMADEKEEGIAMGVEEDAVAAAAGESEESKDDSESDGNQIGEDGKEETEESEDDIDVHEEKSGSDDADQASEDMINFEIEDEDGFDEDEAQDDGVVPLDGAVPLSLFAPRKAFSKSTRPDGAAPAAASFNKNDKKNRNKRTRGVRGGKKSKSKKMRMANQ